MSKIKIRDVEEKVKNMEVEQALIYMKELRDNYSINIDKIIEKYEKKKVKKDIEFVRLEKMTVYENKAYEKGYTLICGIDEAGRGPLAGPVVSCALILERNDLINGVNDSKKLTEKKREELFPIIKERCISYGLGIVDEKKIDKLNILKATKLSMKLAIENLGVKPDYLLIDNEKLESVDIKQEGIVKGDSLSLSIAAASILAKVTRDKIMEDYDSVYPKYGFTRNKGYGTREHIEAIKNFGFCPIHRMSFIKNIK